MQTLGLLPLGHRLSEGAVSVVLLSFPLLPAWSRDAECGFLVVTSVWNFKDGMYTQKKVEPKEENPESLIDHEIPCLCTCSCLNHSYLDLLSQLTDRILKVYFWKIIFSLSLFFVCLFFLEEINMEAEVLFPRCLIQKLPLRYFERVENNSYCIQLLYLMLFIIILKILMKLRKQ